MLRPYSFGYLSTNPLIFQKAQLPEDNIYSYLTNAMATPPSTFSTLPVDFFNSPP